MSDFTSAVEFAPDFQARDFVVVSPLRPIVYPRPLCAVGAARCQNHFVLVPLTEMTKARGTEPRQAILWVDPSIGVLRVRVAGGACMDGAQAVKRLWGLLATAGVETAYLHTNASGLPDDGHDLIRHHDMRTGRQLFRPLDRPSHPELHKAMERMILDAVNFTDTPAVVAEDEVLVYPPLLKTHVRALAAAVAAVEMAVRAGAPSSTRS